MQIFSKDVKIDKVKDPVTSSTKTTGTLVVTSILDMAGYDAVCMVASYGSPAAANKMKMTCCDTTSGTFEDIAGSEVDGAASDEDQYCDVVRPPKRYVQGKFTRTTASTIGDVWAFRYRPRTQAVATNDVAGTQYGKCVIDPATGTA